MPSKLNDPKYKASYDELLAKGQKFLTKLRSEGKVEPKTTVKHNTVQDLHRYQVVYPGGEQPDEAISDNPLRNKPRQASDSAEYTKASDEFERVYGAMRGTAYKPGTRPQPGKSNQPSFPQSGQKGQPGQQGQPGDGQGGEGSESGEGGNEEYENEAQRSYADAVRDLEEQNDPTRDIDAERRKALEEAEKRDGEGDGQEGEGQEGEGKEGGEGKPGKGEGQGNAKNGPRKDEKDASGRPLPDWFTKPVSRHIRRHLEDTAAKVRGRAQSEGKHKYSHNQQWGMGAGSAELTAIGHTPANSTLWEQTVKNFIGTLVKPLAIKSTFQPEARKTSVVNQIRQATGSNIVLWNHNTPNQDKQMFRIYALLDVSGSMFDAQMLTRMKSILMDFKRKDIEFFIFTFDDGITQPVIRDPRDIKTVRGGGGTDFWFSLGSVLKTKGFGWYDVCIVMTDGAFPSIPSAMETTMRKNGLLKRTMFVLTEDNTSAIPHGAKVCRVEGLKVTDIETKK